MGDIYPLTFLFFIVATLYSTAGFGGGSSYIALLILFSVNYTVAPTVALSCNLVVVTLGSIQFIRSKQVLWRLALPFMGTSVFFSYLGGLISISKFHFQLILGICLLIAGLKMLFYKKSDYYSDFLEKPPLGYSLIIGAILGLVSGAVGIGGGIFLAPILYLLKWGNPRYISSTASLFILVNSCAGLFGQFQKRGGMIDFTDFIPLFCAVALGGLLGSFINNKMLSPRKIELSTATLVLAVSLRLFWNLI